MSIFKEKMQNLLQKSTLSVQQMHDFVHSIGLFKGRKVLKDLVIKAGCPDSSKIFPKVVTTSKSTVLRWMHACNAKYKRYAPGFVDRRNHGDVVLQLKDYLLKTAKLQKRQRLYVNRDGTPVLVDVIRAEDSYVESCTNDVNLL